MGALQVIKFSIRQERLDFTDGLIASEEEFGINIICLQTVRELLEAQKIDELMEYLGSSDPEQFF